MIRVSPLWNSVSSVVNEVLGVAEAVTVPQPAVSPAAAEASPRRCDPAPLSGCTACGESAQSDPRCRTLRTRASVSVTRLPDRSRIDEVAGTLLQLQWNRLCLADCARFSGRIRPCRRTVREKSPLKRVCVPEKRQRHRQSDKGRQCVPQRHNVFVLVIRRTVNQLHIGEVWHRNRSVRQFSQPLQVLVR